MCRHREWVTFITSFLSRPYVAGDRIPVLWMKQWWGRSRGRGGPRASDGLATALTPPLVSASGRRSGKGGAAQNSLLHRLGPCPLCLPHPRVPLLTPLYRPLTGATVRAPLMSWGTAGGQVEH